MEDRQFSSAATLSDEDLLRRVLQLAGREREATVELVVRLAELDSRKLYRGEGYGSLFAYCTGALRLGEHAALNRIEAARVSRRFPKILDLLADVSLNLATVRLLAPHLRTDNFEELVAEAKGRSKRQVEVLVARLAPQPDVAASVRKLPTRRPPASEPDPSDAPADVALAPAAPVSETVSAAPTEASEGLAEPCPSPAPAAPPDTPAHRPVVAPLAPQRYRVQFSIGEATHEKLRQVQDLLRREIPDGDPGEIFDRALTLLLEDVARKKVALTPNPRPGQTGGTRSRHIPAHVKRAVWLRDGGRCAFMSSKGRRCAERSFLEFHHCEPYATGGETAVANISLRCRAHNVYESELAFRPGMSATGEAVAEYGAGSRGWLALHAVVAGGCGNSPRGEFPQPVENGRAEPGAVPLGELRVRKPAEPRLPRGPEPSSNRKSTVNEQRIHTSLTAEARPWRRSRRPASEPEGGLPADRLNVDGGAVDCPK